MAGDPLLTVDGLEVTFPSARGPVRATSNVSFSLAEGATLGIVGESGSGKSATLRALCGLVAHPGRMTAGSVDFAGRKYTSEAELVVLRGRELSMIFQDPSNTLNPVRTVGDQLEEMLTVRMGRSRKQASAEAIGLLEQVGIPDPPRRARSYPHELSGGMRQRVMIALALSTEPRVLLADEPTTALDVTTQQQILELLAALQADRGMAVILVSHDLGVVTDFCDDILVLYAGFVVERGDVETMLRRPQHPYTRGLMAAMPTLDASAMPDAIPGQPPDLADLPPGCPFQPRCPIVRERCAAVEMPLESLTACACPFERREEQPVLDASVKPASS